MPTTPSPTPVAACTYGIAPLAPYASDPRQSRGRRIPEPVPPTRTDFQRDRDRIVHSSAFRRLVYKTQVFLNHEGDMFRTRLTHSLEVAQVARSIARPLGLNEDLVETISLAHDLGHTPFGHAGQDALNECMKAFGGFEHNLQSLRVVDLLEQRYAAFDGLNLSFESREGILKHCSAANARRIEAQEPGGIAARFLNGQSPSLEAQLCNLADSIAYNCHDVDDGVRSGLLTVEQLQASTLFRTHHEALLRQHPGLRDDPQRWLYETIRHMLSVQIYDVIEHSRTLLAQHQPASADAARTLPPLIRFSDTAQQQARELKSLLYRELYRHDKVVRTTTLAQQVIRELFHAYLEQPERMKPSYARRVRPGSNPTETARTVADFVAGMTDRYALREHEKLTGYRIMKTT